MSTLTDDQLALDLGEVVEPDRQHGQTIAERFDAFHAANPWVYSALERLAGDWLDRGHTHVGVKQMFEVIRWQHGRATTVTGDTRLRVNNDFTSRYARLLIQRRPEWADAIQTRALRAD